jgi:hypothetical protein
VFYNSAIYIQSFFQSRLGTADYALLVTTSPNYRRSLDTGKAVRMTAAKFKPFMVSVWGFALSNFAYIFNFIFIFKIDVALISETHFTTRTVFKIPNYKVLSHTSP